MGVSSLALRKSKNLRDVLRVRQDGCSFLGRDAFAVGAWSCHAKLAVKLGQEHILKAQDLLDESRRQ